MKNMVAAAASSSVGMEFWAVVLLACAVIHANAGRPITKSYEPASAPEEAPNEKIITFFMQLHSSSSTTATAVVGGANTLNGLGTNGAINVNGGITPQPLTFPAASLPNTNNNGLNIGGAGLIINNGGVGTVGTSIVGGGGLINSNGIGGLINNNGIGGLINGNGVLGGIGGQQLGGGILSNPATNVPSGEAAGVQQGAFPEMMTLEQPLYEEPEQEATTVMGMAQGYYLPSLLQHEEVMAHVMSIAFTATLTHIADEEDIPSSSIQLAGQLNSIDEKGSGEGEMIVVGGTGVFHGATGHAMVQPLPDHQGLLKFTVSLVY